MLAEDALQDALSNALERWEINGVSRNPGAWLTTVAKHRALLTECDTPQPRKARRSSLTHLLPTTMRRKPRWSPSWMIGYN